MDFFPSSLLPLKTPNAQALDLGSGSWRLEIPASPEGDRAPYAVAQLDDYHALPRRDFPWQPPCSFSLRARLSAQNLPGTWGFGWWNDPFSLNLGIGGASRRFPALPNAAWFFYASPPNYLSFRDDLPAQGFLAATFHAPQVPAALLALASPGLAFGILPATARLLRRLLRQYIRQDAHSLPELGTTDWHDYTLTWKAESVSFFQDEQEIFQTPIVPRGPLGFVLWIDNQFAAFPPGGRLSFGSLPCPQAALIEIENLHFSPS